MTTTVRTSPQSRSARKLETIGAVCSRLRDEFPDISISKIRYLEDQGLLSPRRTPGGYRLFSEEDIQRLESILRLQRDEFLPLRVIREELATRLTPARRGRATDLGERAPEIALRELCDRAAISAELAHDLEEYGLLTPSIHGGERYYTELDVETALACGRLASSGKLTARHLRTFRTTADRAAGLLGQVTAPALRSRNPERHQEGLEELRTLGEATQDLIQLLLWRELRRIASA